jgi:RNA polymerase sigma-70 factor, ECF subfamily
MSKRHRNFSETISSITMKLEKLLIDQEVLQKARQLDERALATLVRECFPFVFRYLYYRSITREDAEDLTSEVFVRVVNSIKSQKGYFPAWLIRIAKNLLTDYYRKRGKSRETCLEEIQEPFSDSDKNRKDTLHPDDIRRMLDRLTEDQKEVIVLKFIEGNSNEEIAKIMSKSTGAIKTLQFRALSALRVILKKED